MTRFTKSLAVAGAAALLGTLAAPGPVSATPVAEPAGLASPTTQRAGAAVQLTQLTGGTIAAGDVVSFTGRTPRSMNRTKLVLQRRIGKQKWVKVARTSRVKARRFTVSGVAISPGPNKWRVKGKTRAGKVLRSSATSHAVYTWYSMTEENAVDYDSWDLDYAPSSIGSVTFPGALILDFASAGEGASVSWNASYKCVEFAAGYGLDNDSVNGSVGRFWVDIDGMQQDLGTKALGNPTEVSFDLTSHMRITLGLGVVAPDDFAATFPAWGDPRMLCSSSPF